MAGRSECIIEHACVALMSVQPPSLSSEFTLQSHTSSEDCTADATALGADRLPRDEAAYPTKQKYSRTTANAPALPYLDSLLPLFACDAVELVLDLPEPLEHRPQRFLTQLEVHLEGTARATFRTSEGKHQSRITSVPRPLLLPLSEVETCLPSHMGSLQRGPSSFYPTHLSNFLVLKASYT